MTASAPVPGPQTSVQTVYYQQQQQNPLQPQQMQFQQQHDYQQQLQQQQQQQFQQTVPGPINQSIFNRQSLPANQQPLQQQMVQQQQQPNMSFTKTYSALPILKSSYQMHPSSYVTLDKMPANINCPRCNAPIITQLKTKTGTTAVVAAVAIAFVFWPLAFLPFMSKRMKKTIHVCPNCQHNLGKVVTVSAVPNHM
ncbi:LITAF-like zinc ribbon domain-containing protein [Kickxella alabastrina]|uniref:LITAF-like zinc ribbon domain-containing protein n=1 Tax=Kickxella alabastrina TaxID=61397 RepID=UPI00221FDDDF|nr:LITAF-like zinc ribbon domain-containing protein [Kickxella alabastrina]KAI7829099.1 LITAF-like zinc ribbon domain-containing protein [Kickxella alabastrina]